MHKQSRFRRGLYGALCTATAIVALLAVGPGDASAADEAAWMFDPGTVAEIELGGLSSEEMDALEAEPDEYQHGTFELKVGGVAKGPPLGEVGIRLKGTGSFRGFDRKAAFKVKFNEYVSQTFLGLKKLTLNNMVQDPSMLCETLAYELFRGLGVPSSRTGFADVSVNGTSYGVYLNIETLDKVFLPHWFGSTRHLYEADMPGVDVEPGRAGDFEVQEGSESDLTDLEALIAAANGATGDWSDGMAAVADLAEMTKMWAVERYVGHWDGYAGQADPEAEAFRPNNYYLHDEDTGPDTGRFRMLPWGTDQTWGKHVEFDEPSGGLMFNRCLGDQSCKALYVQALRELQKVVAGLDLDGQAVALSTQLGPWQALETDPRREFSPAQIEAGVEEARAFVASRPAELAAWLPVEANAKETTGGSGGGQSQPGGAATSPAVPAARLRIDSALTAGRVLRSRLHLPSAGNVSQVVTVAKGRRRVRVCAAHARVAQAGTLTLRCRLTPQVRRRLRRRWLRLLVVTRFQPLGGTAETFRKKVRVPRLGR
jgi:hypothetical protein